MGEASMDDIDAWLKGFELESLEKTLPGNWSFVQKSGDSVIQISVMYTEADPPTPPMIGVGCIFLDPPEKNHLQLYERLLELHTISHETKFCKVKNGAIMLITHRSVVDLDQSELKEMIDTVVMMYNQFHDDCLKIVA
ncbi:MAG: hypothetical protein JSW28_03150 [Thermoplasmata archaeon]|nr:MAG: hypothetical protein JSW28_03150 [Thermoplasmata archaeon]